jgi:hypothetical protein
MRERRSKKRLQENGEWGGGAAPRVHHSHSHLPLISNTSGSTALISSRPVLGWFAMAHRISVTDFTGS